MKKEKIENLLLDLGGVLYDIDFQKAVSAFSALGIKDFHSVYAHAHQSELFDRFESGKISAAEFRNAIRKMTGTTLSDPVIDSAWNALLIGIPEKNIPLLEKLSEKYTLFLLSNTNDIHLSAVEHHIESAYGLQRFEKYFRKIYYSNRIGMRKPDADCFEFVLRDAGISKENTLFIDDTTRHVEGAKKTGLQAVHLNLPEDTTHSLLKKLQLL